MKSFIATVEAGEGLLLGGVIRVVSSRFESANDAVSWICVTMDANRVAGRHPVNRGVRKVALRPEVLRGAY